MGSVTRRVAVGRAELDIRLILQAVPLPIWIYDSESSHLLAVNRAALDALGYTLWELVHMKVQDICPADANERVHEELGEKEGAALSLPGSYVPKDGTACRTLFHTRSVTFEDRPAVLVVAGARSIRLEPEPSSNDEPTVVRHISEAEEIRQRVRRLAHECNNVLAIILSHVEFASDRVAGDPEMLADLEAIRSAARRGASLVHGLGTSRSA